MHVHFSLFALNFLFFTLKDKYIDCEYAAQYLLMLNIFLHF